MIPKNKSKIQLKCRRGMLELDIIIMSFFYNYYDSLTNYEKFCFEKLLEYDDINILNWLINCKRTINDTNLKKIISIIQKTNNHII